MKASISLAALSLALAAGSAQAHKAWLLPSATVLSGANPWITVDAAVSNDLFYFNHVPLRIEGLQITAPDGSTLAPQNLHTGKYRSVFDLPLQQTGTYRIAAVSAGWSARWQENGERKGWRGQPEDYAANVPKDAEQLQVSQVSNRIETYVTNGAPTSTLFQASGNGLEMLPVTHPNDLYAEESATFQLLLNGMPAVGMEVEIVSGGTRYRNAQEAILVQTDEQGRFSVTWPAPGMYWLEAVVQDQQAIAPATSRRAGYVVTLEVLPQ